MLAQHLHAAIDRPPRFAQRLLVSLAIPLAACAHLETARPDAAWDQAFTRTDGWTAGDIAHSIDLGDGRTLWLFGDSLVGPVRDGAHVPGQASFVRGAIGWHRTPRDGSPPPDLNFAVGPGPTASGSPPQAAWISPDPGLWPEKTWYWLMGDGAIVPGPDGAPRLVLFAAALGPSGNPDPMWNFRRVGGVILEVAKPGADPSQWRVTQRANPIVQPDPLHGETPRARDSWGAALVASPGPDAAPGPSADLYVFGVRSLAPGENALLVARSSPPDLGAPERWRFFDGAGWSTDAKAAAPVAEGVVDEFTVHAVGRGGERRLLLVQSEPMLGRRILARAAARPEGPWSAPATLWTVEEPARDERLMTYAAKAHPHLSRRGELLISYIINTRDPKQWMTDAGLYRPRFVRVPASVLPAAPDRESRAR